MWNFFDDIANLQGYYLAVVIGFAALFLLCVLLRVVLAISYQTVIALINHSAKGIKSKHDIDKLGGGAFCRGAKEYVQLAQSGAKVDALELAQLSVRKNRLLFFNFASIDRLINALETAFLPLAILFAISLENPITFAILAGLAFAVLRIIGAIFDIQGAKERYIATLAHALTKEVGKFFPPDTSSAIYTFGADMKEYLSRQSAMYSDLLIKINGEFTESLKTNISAMTSSVEATLFAVSRHDGLGTALDEIKGIGVAAAAISAGMSEAGKGLARLTDVQAVEQSLEMVRKNQDTLDAAVAKYETTLKDITSQMGDALGKIITHHLGNTNSQIADNINENLAQTKMANFAYIEDMKAIFAELAEQNRQQTKILIKLIKATTD
ncbi:MAG: hypothetical protein FWE44_03725 [Defluviitaleaceae bacterium]|nr:hypothetical protein [Defluviitaleaceae bacterium]